MKRRSFKKQAKLFQDLYIVFKGDIFLFEEVLMKLVGFKFVVAELIHFGLYLAHILVLVPGDCLTLHHFCQLQ